MHDALKKLIDAATAGQEIDVDRGPRWPSRNGLVHITAGAVADAVREADAEGRSGDDLLDLARHIVAELAEAGGVRRRAAEKRERGKTAAADLAAAMEPSAN